MFAALCQEAVNMTNTAWSRTVYLFGYKGIGLSQFLWWDEGMQEVGVVSITDSVFLCVLLADFFLASYCFSFTVACLLLDFQCCTFLCGLCSGVGWPQAAVLMGYPCLLHGMWDSSDVWLPTYDVTGGTQGHFSSEMPGRAWDFLPQTMLKRVSHTDIPH